MKRVLKWCGSTTAVVLVLAVAGIGALLIWKPWAPEIVVSEQGPGGQRITEDGLLANYYPAEETAPGILVLGGSEGGIGAGSDLAARALHAEGYSVMVLSYWDGEDQEPRMENLPLEQFDTAIAWLQEQDEVDPDSIGLYGGSKGAEAALLVASRNPAVSAVVANAPSHVAWAGLDLAEIWRMASIGSTWSADGEPVPYVPYAGSTGGDDLVETYKESLAADPAAVEQATIPVESIDAPIIMVCGEADTMWPSCDMGRQVEQRAAERDGPTVTLLAYEDAGHMAQGPPAEPGSSHHESLDSFGGSTDGNQAALEDSWPQVLEFLDTQLRV